VVFQIQRGAVTSDGSGSEIFDLGRVGSTTFGLGLENFPKNPNFSIFSVGLKKNLFGWGQEVSPSNTGQPIIY